MIKKIYKLDNVDCAACANKIENRLADLVGMNKCSLNFFTLRLAMIYDETILEEATIDKNILKSLHDVKIISKETQLINTDDLEEPKQFRKIKFGFKRKI